ncbi:MAG: hypothetical protein B6D56_02800 [Candidatus Omnitrophica bacterium 4484_70.1]|nr:MAG: hypothetical protein B6D56_02800 [Candidatus Omnitrophica bacterium 4484_70.1]
MIYKFIDEEGKFSVENPYRFSYLYFPLTNKEGSIFSSISPNLAGDIKKDNDRFLTIPVSIEDIKNNPLAKREFFIKIKENGKIFRLSLPWQKDRLEIGLLYHKLIKENEFFYTEVVNFVPFDLDVEVMWIKLINKKNVRYKPTFFLPLYGRGGKNLRDHRHVTSLLNRIKLQKFGIILKPTLVFDERKHRENDTLYFVWGTRNGKPPAGQFPTLLEFLGETLLWEYPEAIYKDKKPYQRKKKEFDGKEVCAALQFSSTKIKEAHYIFIMGITLSKKYIREVFLKLNNFKKVERYLNKTEEFWKKNLRLRFKFHNFNFDNWLLWVGTQPTLRKLFGCSFLPHFDYGKGGRGWRDLWQDLLTLILNDEEVETLILNNLKGIRIDGTNATIITSQGEFIADRNRISRVWTDHGIWPLLTLELYLRKTNNLDILFRKIPYFRDYQIMRAKEFDFQFNQKDNFLRTKDNKIYKGTVLEHLLLQNLIAFFNVGKHNFLRLENGDWNDGLDMAPQKGESIPFYCMYAYNFLILEELLKKIREERRIKRVEIFEELLLLLDSIYSSVDYSNYQEKLNRLNDYLEKTKFFIKGKKVKIEIEKIISDLRKKTDWMSEYVKKRAWLKKEKFFLGYYDNKGKPAEGIKKKRIGLLLQSQVFPLLSGVANKIQAKFVWYAVNKYLKDKELKGYRLNTDFGGNYLDLGRAFSFSFGDKENGAFFNHMVVMFAHSLYRQGFLKEGFKVLESVYKMATSPHAKIYPMIPEYFNREGKGLYFYLTGSASWFIYTLFKEVLGIKFSFGDLIIQPKLIRRNFFKDIIEVKFRFSHLPFHIIFIRPKREKGKIYRIEKGILNKRTPLKKEKDKIILPKKEIEKLPLKECLVEIYLR